MDNKNVSLVEIRHRGDEFSFLLATLRPTFFIARQKQFWALFYDAVIYTSLCDSEWKAKYIIKCRINISYKIYV